jgi:acetyl esterase/lipase
MTVRVALRPVSWCFFALLTLTSTACTKFDFVNATVTKHGYALTRDIRYGDQPRQQLDVYRPPHPNGGVVVFFYGGSWLAGEKGDYRFVGQALTSRGFVAVLPDYRLYPQVKFPAFLQDGAKAVRWAHDHAAQFGADPHRLYLMGHSAGAYIAVMLALDADYLHAIGLEPSSAVRAVAGLSGPYEFNPGPDTRPVFGMSQAEDAKPDPQIEPVTFANGRSPPVLLIHGLDDHLVDPDNSATLSHRIRDDGGKATFLAYPTLDHKGTVLALAASFRWLAPVLCDTTRYFNHH